MEKIVCLDTNVISWGFKKTATPGQEEMLVKAEALLKDCKLKNIKILIPSLVMGESMAPLEPKDYPKYTQIFSKKAMVAQFDVRASIMYARLWHARKAACKAINMQKCRMKIDMMILATAIVNNADCVYTEDNDMVTVAGDFIEVRILSQYF
ncbi:type II toxin-antitoxin system VapC family toxin [Picosynechococcus sp. PCC 8807]|uniref:type II toxin-antitoxin system VapC family toxin n=1 Tax=Picosynechococcus sp. PCC 8807 TaxID=195248 RepID=UPI0008107011|nr:PIN domain-containing protein [Picosynechococcus sp. PCC 8807]ANV90787.1 hypothetical protein AWQ24_09165 [Picosynechococcus sp. PCC 8807]